MKNLEYIIFMKYGVHSNESIDSIIKRKTEEIKNTGFMFWGYSGTLCHPTKQINALANEIHNAKKPIYLVMSYTKSNNYNQPIDAELYSSNGVDYLQIPKGISVKGSRYAIVCEELEQCDFNLNLSEYSIATGNSKGKNLSTFIQGRVDKAFALKGKQSDFENKYAHITLIGKVASPYSVLIKNNLPQPN